MLGATLILIYMMEDLGCKNHFLGTLMATTGAFLAGCVLTATWTGRLIDEWGPKKVMWFGYVFWAFIPFWWLFLTPGSILWIIATVNFVAGLFVTAGSNAYLKIQTRYPPAGHRAMYVAVSNSANYVASALAALAAGVIVRWLDGWSWTWPNGWHFGRYDVLAAGSLALRVATVIFLLRGIRESPPETGLPGQPLASSGDFWGGKEWGTGA
jgi:MFS family permease